MIINYCKIAWRSLMKNKAFSLINIFGLAVGFTCCLLITLYLDHELNYDKQHPDADHIYQVGTIFVRQNEEKKGPTTPALMGTGMQQEFPEIQENVRLIGLFQDDKTILRYNKGNTPAVSFYETAGFLADPGFFRFFKYDFIEGDAASALNNPNTVVLDEDIAAKLFGKEPALNKTIHVSSATNGETDVLITGVFRNNHLPSHINGRFFMSFKGGDIDRYAARSKGLAFDNMFFTYLKLRNGADATGLEKKFPAFIDKYAGNDLKNAGFYKKQFLVPVKDIHLRSGMENDVTTSGSVTYLYILGSIALFALLIACINFMNLSTARSSKRAMEVGIRKVMGAHKGSLVTQFLGESLLTSFIAFIVSLLLAWLCLPAFAGASGKDLHFSFASQSWIIAGLFALCILTGLLAGLYPAFYLSAFKPVSILKNKSSSHSLATISLRKGLVVFQFLISAVLIISSTVISRQMHFMRSQDLGFIKDQEVIIPLRSQTAKDLYPSLKTELTKLSGITSAGASYYYPGIFNAMDRGIYKEGKTMQDAIGTKINVVDENYIQTIGLKTIAGRSFSAQFPGDTANAIVINEEGIRKLGFANAQEAIGKPVFSDARTMTIIGVTKDFHFEDLHVPITPYVFQLNRGSDYNYIMVHTRTGIDISTVMKQVGQVWHSLNPNEPFEYNFLDEQFAKNYQAQDRLSDIVRYFAIIAIFISCLGLFGLATFSVEQRTKEIGIRKVLGATVTNIILLISKDFLKLVLLAIILASPIAWWIMNKWLQGFAYRTNIGWQVFTIAGFIALLIAIVTISTQAIQAAIANPVKNLRTE